MKIYGENSEEKFKFLEKVLPKMSAHAAAPEKIVIPGTIISHYLDEANVTLFSVLLFAGKVEKIAFAYESAVQANTDDKVELDVSCYIGNPRNQQVSVFKTKKVGAVYALDLDVADGDTIKVVNNNKDVTFFGINVSLLFLPKRRVVDRDATRKLLQG